LKNLADVVEPVKDYKREETAPVQPTSETPLNRIVDAISLESRKAREFEELVDKFVSANCHDEAMDTRLRSQLTVWRDNDAKLPPLIQRSYLAKQVGSTSRDLSAVATAGLAALDALEHPGNADEAWRAQQLVVLQQAENQKDQLLLMPVGAIQKLVEAVAAGGSCSAAKQ
jgi:hexosaminidase